MVSLDQRVDGTTLAVISPETDGVVSIMNGKGRLVRSTLVTGRAEHGPEALRATEVFVVK